MSPGIVEQGGKVATSAVDAMKGTPLSIALLAVNMAFLAFVGYVLGEVAENAKVRNTSQMDLISKLVTDIRDCRQGPPGRGDLDHLLPQRFPAAFHVKPETSNTL
jgi:hypothetical protein